MRLITRFKNIGKFQCKLKNTRNKLSFYYPSIPDISVIHMRFFSWLPRDPFFLFLFFFGPFGLVFVVLFLFLFFLGSCYYMKERTGKQETNSKNEFALDTPWIRSWVSIELIWRGWILIQRKWSCLVRLFK